MHLKYRDMKDIKDILTNYMETPSEEVWERLSARLDQEMPVAKQRTSTWKWVAGVAAALICGVVLFAVFHNRADNQRDIVQNEVEIAVDETNTQSEPAVVASTPAEEPVTEPVTEVREEPAARPKAEPADKTEPAPESTAAPKTNVRQVVLPPNSTLARQLAADPVLKNLSDDSVEWSKPVHLTIPNLFTPNNDGVNDQFVIEGIEQYGNPKLVIRDRSNKVVYQSDNYQNTWGGDDCPDGLYNYTFTFVYNGICNEATGKVRIIRS